MLFCIVGGLIGLNCGFHVGVSACQKIIHSIPATIAVLGVCTIGGVAIGITTGMSIDKLL